MCPVPSVSEGVSPILPPGRARWFCRTQSNSRRTGYSGESRPSGPGTGYSGGEKTRSGPSETLWERNFGKPPGLAHTIELEPEQGPSPEKQPADLRSKAGYLLIA